MFLESIENKWKSISVRAKCDECGVEYKAKISTAIRQQEQVGHHQCRKCSSRRAGKKTAAKMSEIYSLLYSGDGNFAKKQGVGEKISKAKKGKPLSEEHKSALCKSKIKTDKFIQAMNDPGLKGQRSERMKKNNPMNKLECREKVSNSIAKLYQNGFYKSHPKYKTGWFESDKNINPIYFRSGLERDFLNAVSNCDWINSIESAEKIKISYQYQGINHNYLPDFKIIFDNNISIIVEIKSTYFEKLPNWEFKLEALKNFCKLMNLDYLILTEKDESIWQEQLKELKQKKEPKHGI